MNGNCNTFRPRSTIKGLGTFTLPVLDMTNKGTLFHFLGEFIQVPTHQFLEVYVGVKTPEGSN